MRNLLYLIIALVMTGCSQEPSGESKSVGATVRVAKEMLGSIKYLSSQLKLSILSKRGIDNMRHLIARGGETADNAILAYREGHTKNLTDWLGKMIVLNRERVFQETRGDVQQLADIYGQMAGATQNALGAFGKHADQIDEITKEIADPKKKVEVITKLRADTLLKSEGYGVTMVRSHLDFRGELGAVQLLDSSSKFSDDLRSLNEAIRNLVTGKENIDTDTTIKFRKVMADWMVAMDALDDVESRAIIERGVK